MATVIVDGQEIAIGEDERLNGIEVARRVGQEIPHYCWHPGLSVVASCRMCLVETGKCDPETGDINMLPKLVPACQTPATDGTVFVTNSEKVRQARAMVEEDLLIRHPIDCPICDKAGECSLQDYHFEHGQGQRRADLKPFNSRRRELGETVTLFVDRCVMCSRCVRFCREITGTSELMVSNRGAHEEIDVFPGFPLENKLSGNVVDLCPVGALGDKDFLYKQRVWFMKSHDHVCAGCATGCSIHVEENQDRVYRLKPRENSAVNQWWMCDDGRYGWKYVHDEARLTQPRRRKSDQWEMCDWSDLVDLIGTRLSQAGKTVAVLSPFVTCEEAYLMTRYLQQLPGASVAVMGPVPRQGQDEVFPNGFQISAEKCPNRRGVELVLAESSVDLLEWDQLVSQLAAGGDFDAVWVCGGYPSDWISTSDAAHFQDVGTLIVQDLFESPLAEHADFLLPSAAFVELEGSFVNAQDHLQSFAWAVRPPSGVRPVGHLLWQYLQHGGLYSARRILQEMAGELPGFAVASEQIPAEGIALAAPESVS